LNAWKPGIGVLKSIWEDLMYIGVGTIVAILLLVLLLAFVF
jgi:hypothetical protein